VYQVEKLREAKATTLRRKRLARSCVMGVEHVVGEVKGVEEVGVGFACRGRGAEGTEGARLRLTRSAVAFAIIPTLFLRPLKKAARLEKRQSLDWAALADLLGGRMGLPLGLFPRERDREREAYCALESVCLCATSESRRERHVSHKVLE